MKRTMCQALLLAATGLSLSACGPFFHAASTPPPTRTASLNRASDHIEISTGVALAFECRDGNGEPCKDAKAVSQDAGIAKVLPAHINLTTERWRWTGPQPRTGFVVYGVAPGKTTLRVTYDGDDHGELSVTVVPDPAPGPAAAKPPATPGG